MESAARWRWFCYCEIHYRTTGNTDRQHDKSYCKDLILVSNDILFQDLSLKAGWDNVGEVPSGQPLSYKVEDLVAKKTYKFRIRAVNKIGSSEPGLFGKPVLAKDPWGKIF